MKPKHQKARVLTTPNGSNTAATNSTNTKKFKPKQFRVATEGATTDGRKIERSWIEQMAANYDPKTYGARVWLEHIRSLYPDSAFRAYGDVLALEAKPIDGGKLALFATIEPLPELVEMTTKAKQKVYTSIEVNPKFADSGEAYLTGLAVTDSPASLGTEVLAFAAQNPDANPFATRKSSNGCLFSAAESVQMEFDPAIDDDGKKFADRLKSLIGEFSAKFSGKAHADDQRFAAVTQALEAIVDQVTEQYAAQTERFAHLQAAQIEFRAEMLALIDSTDANRHSQRPVATGAGASAGTRKPEAAETDC